MYDNDAHFTGLPPFLSEPYLLMSFVFASGKCFDRLIKFLENYILFKFSKKFMSVGASLKRSDYYWPEPEPVSGL